MRILCRCSVRLVSGDDPRICLALPHLQITQSHTNAQSHKHTNAKVTTIQVKKKRIYPIFMKKKNRQLQKAGKSPVSRFPTLCVGEPGLVGPTAPKSVLLVVSTSVWSNSACRHASHLIEWRWWWWLLATIWAPSDDILPWDFRLMGLQHGMLYLHVFGLCCQPREEQGVLV